MPNSFKIEIELPGSDGFHTRDDAHLAEIARDRIQEFLDDAALFSSGTCTVRVVRAEETTGRAEEPRYLKVARSLRLSIEKGKLRPGDRVPGSWDLAEMYGVSRHTAQRALGLLQREGLVEAGRGLGTFVRTPGKGPSVLAARAALHARMCQDGMCRYKRADSPSVACRTLDGMLDDLVDGARGKSS